MINTGIPGCPTIESIQARVEKMMSVYEKIKSRSNYNFDNVAAVESYCPGGKSMDIYFSATPIADKHRVALEEMSRGIVALIIGAIAAVVAAVFKIYKFLTTGSSGGSGGGGSDNGPTLANTDDEGRIVKPEEAITHTIEVVEPQSREFIELGNHAADNAHAPTQEHLQEDVLRRIEALGDHIETRSKSSRKWTNCIIREHGNNTVIGRILNNSDTFFSGMFRPRGPSGRAFIDDLGPTTEYVRFCTKMLGEMSIQVKAGNSIESKVEEIKKKTHELFKLGAGQSTLQDSVAMASDTYRGAVTEADNLQAPCAKKDHVKAFMLNGTGGLLSAPGRFLREFNIHNIGSGFYDLKKHVQPLQLSAKALDEYYKAFEKYTEGATGDDDGSVNLKDLLHGANLKDMFSAIQIVQLNLKSYVFAYNIYIQEVSAYLNTYREICSITLLHPEEFVKGDRIDSATRLIKEIRSQMKEVRAAIESFTNLPEIKIR